MDVTTVKVEAADDGQRLDRWLKKKFPAIPFGQMQKILRTGQLRVDGKRAKGETRLSAGQAVRIPPQMNGAPPPRKAGVSEKDAAFIRSLVLYQDDHVIALNKPSGIATQGGSKVTRHIDGLLEGLARDGRKPHLVHRLDRDTSGVLLLARDPKTAAELGRLFQGRDVRKYYWAVTTPAPAQKRGKIQSYIAKVEGRGGERVMAVGAEEGKSALTLYAVRDSVGGQAAFVVFWPRTGRTHQIRVHATEIGCPLLGDFKYAPAQPLLESEPGLPQTLHLHARRLVLSHPSGRGTIDVTAPLPDGMRKTFAHFGFDPNDREDPFADERL